MEDHWTTRSWNDGIEQDILEIFRGKWGEGGGPRNPLVFDSRCDHDYKPFPSGSDFLQSSCRPNPFDQDS